MKKTEWTSNATYQKLFDKEQELITEDACVEFYDKTHPLYLETDASGIRPGVPLLKTRSDTSCPRDKSTRQQHVQTHCICKGELVNAERKYNNNERETLGILPGLRKFHHYCFVRELSIITDHKLLVAILEKDVPTLYQKIQ